MPHHLLHCTLHAVALQYFVSCWPHSTRVGSLLLNLNRLLVKLSNIEVFQLHDQLVHGVLVEVVRRRVDLLSEGVRPSSGHRQKNDSCTSLLLTCNSCQVNRLHFVNPV